MYEFQTRVTSISHPLCSPVLASHLTFYVISYIIRSHPIPARPASTIQNPIVDIISYISRSHSIPVFNIKPRPSPTFPVSYCQLTSLTLANSYHPHPAHSYYKSNTSCSPPRYQRVPSSCTALRSYNRQRGRIRSMFVNRTRDRRLRRRNSQFLGGVRWRRRVQRV